MKRDGAIYFCLLFAVERSINFENSTRFVNRSDKNFVRFFIFYDDLHVVSSN